MKNKIKGIAVVMIAVILSGSVVYAQVKSQEGTSRQTMPVMLYDFETQYERANVISRYVFGKTVLSEEHVKSGEKSLYCEVSGIYPEHEETHLFGPSREVFSSNYLKLSTLSNKSFTCEDWSQLDSVSIDIYNDSDRDAHMNLYLQVAPEGRKYNYFYSYYVPLGEKVLVKGRDNHLDFTLDYVRYKGIESVVAVYFVFDNRQEGETPLKLYMDNFCGNQLAEKPVLSYPTRSGKLLSGFEEMCEAEMFDQELLYQSISTMAREERSSERATEGDYSLKITLPATNDYYLYPYSNPVWPGYNILWADGAKWFSGIDINQMLKEENSSAEDYEVCIDVYTDFASKYNIELMGVGCRLEPGQWHTVRKNLSQFTYVNGYLELRLAFFEFQDESDHHVWLDNLRIERIK